MTFSYWIVILLYWSHLSQTKKWLCENWRIYNC